MKLRNGAAGFTASFCLLVAACAPSPRSATEYYLDYPTYDTPTGLVEAADAIVRGRVLSTRVEELYPDMITETDPALNPQAGLDETQLEEVEPIIITIATVKVTEVVKGEVRANARIEVSQVGGQLDGARYVAHGTTLVVPRNQEYVFVLAAHPGAPFDLVNPELGLYDAEPRGELTHVSRNNTLPIGSLSDLYDAVDAS